MHLFSHIAKHASLFLELEGFGQAILDLVIIRPNCIHCHKIPRDLQRVVSFKDGDDLAMVWLYVPREGTCECCEPIRRFKRPGSLRQAEELITLFDLARPDAENPSLVQAEKARSLLLSNTCLFCCRKIAHAVAADEEPECDFEASVFSYTGDERTDERFAMVASMGIEPTIGYFAARGWSE